MIKTPIAVINDFSGGQDTRTPIISMGLNKSPNMRNFHCAGVKDRLMKRGGYSKINNIAVTSDNLDTYYPPGYTTYDYPLRTTVAYTQIAQGFKPCTSGDVTKVKLWLKKTGTPAGTDTITLEIQSDSSGVPSGTEVTNGVATAVDISATLSTSYAWVTFTFATAPTLVAGTQYHLVLQGAFTVSSSNYVSWGADNFDIIYPSGSMSKYDSSLWSADINYDACFELYVDSGCEGDNGVAIYDFASKNMLLGVFGTSLYKMDKSALGTPDGVWDGIIVGSTTSGTIDYMEYTSDTLAQAAYVTNESGYTGDLTGSGTATASSTLAGYPASNMFDDNAATFFSTENGGGSAGWVKYDFGAGVAHIFRRVTITSHTNIADLTPNDFTIEGSNDNSNWTVLSTQTDVTWTPEEKKTFDFTNNTAYRYIRINWTSANGPGDYVQLQEMEVMGLILQCYSETTVKNQGSYSLKVSASITDSLNKTLTKTIGSPIDLTSKTTIYFDIYAARTGANIKIGIHDSGGTTSEKTYTVLAENTWETVTWDISAVADADKNAIDSIIITILNADADNLFYLDNMFAIETGTEFNLTSSRYFTFADWQSGRALINTDTGLYTYTGTGNASVVSAAPISKFVVIFRNYVFAAGIRGLPNTIRYSDLSDYTTWTASQVLTVNTNDGDVITGMRILKGKLYIFKRYSIHRISYLGSNPTFQVDQILGIGCPAHYTIKEVEMGGDVGTVLIFLTTDKKLAVFDGYSVQVINDSLTEETNDLFGVSDDQPLSFADINLIYSDLFHAVVKNDTSEYILYCVLGTDTAINYAFVFDYKTGGVYPYDGQIFASSCYAISTDKNKILYCAGYTGYMWQLENGTADDGSAIRAYWVSAKIKPVLVSLLMKALNLGINFKQIYSLTTLNASFQFRIDWNVSWTTAENFAFNRADVLTFGATALFDIGTIENMLQIKIVDDSDDDGLTLYGVDLYGTQALGHSVGERETA